MEPIKIQMLGEFSLSRGDTVIRESDTRSRRVWQLLAYLLCRRGKSFSLRSLITLLRDISSDVSNPENALRILLYRTGLQLDPYI